MKIKSILFIIAILPTVAGFVTLGAQDWQRNQLNRYTDQENVLQDIQKTIFDLSLLGRELGRPASRLRAERQWDLRFASLGALLKNMDFSPKNAKTNLTGLLQAYRKMGKTASLYRASTIKNDEINDFFVRRNETEVQRLLGLAQRIHNTIETDRQNTIQFTQVITNILIALATIGISILAWTLGRHIMKPIEQVRAKMQIVGRGDLSIKIGLTETNEIGDLARDIDRTLEQLATTVASRDILEKEIEDRIQAQDAVLALNATLEERVEARTAQLEAANAELESFAYSVSHDLRAPLRTIDGYSQALVEDYADKLDGEARIYLDFLRAGAQSMGRLIDAILLLSRATRGEMVMGPVDLSDLAQSVVQEIADNETDRPPCFRIEPGLVAWADERLMKAVLENLLGNAWKYTRNTENPVIEFGAATVDGRRVFHVRDNGAGFDMTYADKLFQPFQRLHSAREFEGTGIGLSTVQRIIARHRGTVWGEGAVGKGATIYFELREENSDERDQENPVG